MNKLSRDFILGNIDISKDTEKILCNKQFFTNRDILVFERWS